MHTVEKQVFREVWYCMSGMSGMAESAWAAGLACQALLGRLETWLWGFAWDLLRWDLGSFGTMERVIGGF